VFETHHQQLRPQGGSYWPNGHHAEEAVYTEHQLPRQSQLVSHQQQQHFNGVSHGAVSVHQQYTPEAAMQGIAAEDPRLQETWQSYMYKVGSPRLMLDD